jgi:predicted metal-dependent RNase
VKNIVIIHGSEEDALALASKLRRELGDDVNIYTPQNGESIELKQ